MEHFFPIPPDPVTPLQTMNIIQEDPPASRNEILRVIQSLPNKKSPGMDLLDYEIWKTVFALHPSILLQPISRCLQVGYFPACLKHARVIFIPKSQGTATDPSSFRPISLLPTLGKILEKVFANRLNHWLDNNNILHTTQFGFRENTGTEKAIHHLLNTVKSHKGLNHVAITSIDIRAAFDNIHWSTLISKLQAINLPEVFLNFLSHFLNNRKVSFIEDQIHLTHEMTKGAPQGSILGPTLWNLYLDSVLRLKIHNTMIQAFADDILVVTHGSSRRILEETAATAIDQLIQNITQLHLEISTTKTKALVIGKLKPLQRTPIIATSLGNIKIVKILKYLGLIINQTLTWADHIQYIRNKLFKINSSFSRIVTRSFQKNRKFTRTWYLSVCEKVVAYGAGIWARSLTKQQAQALKSIVRPFLLRISQSYRTTPTDGLFLFLQITPIDILLNNLAKKFEFLISGTNNFNLPNDLQHDRMDRVIKIAEVDPSQRILNIQTTPLKTATTIYTDGSKLEDSVGFAFCVFENNTPSLTKMYQLRPYNTVFQAEVAAIYEAVKWLQLNNTEAEIYSDSLSAIQALGAYNNKSAFLHRVRGFLQQQIHRFSLGWVKAHSGIPENELVDEAAKRATKEGTVYSVAQPRSLVKATLKKNLRNDWDAYWSTSVRHPRLHQFYPLTYTVTDPIFSSSLVAFLSGHGPFPTYLKRFHRREDSLCPCGATGEPEHYLKDCPYTDGHHLDARFSSLLASSPFTWLQMILEDDTARSNVHQCFLIAMEKMKE